MEETDEEGQNMLGSAVSNSLLQEKSEGVLQWSALIVQRKVGRATQNSCDLDRTSGSKRTLIFSEMTPGRNTFAPLLMYLHAERQTQRSSIEVRYVNRAKLTVACSNHEDAVVKPSTRSLKSVGLSVE